MSSSGCKTSQRSATGSSASTLTAPSGPWARYTACQWLTGKNCLYRMSSRRRRMPAGGGLRQLALLQPLLRPLGPMQTLRARATSHRLTPGSHRYIRDLSAHRSNRNSANSDFSHAARASVANVGRGGASIAMRHLGMSHICIPGPSQPVCCGLAGAVGCLSPAAAHACHPRACCLPAARCHVCGARLGCPSASHAWTPSRYLSVALMAMYDSICRSCDRRLQNYCRLPDSDLDALNIVDFKDAWSQLMRSVC